MYNGNYDVDADFDVSHPVLDETNEDREYEAAMAAGQDATEGFYPGWHPEEDDADYTCEHGHVSSDECLACIAQGGAW